MLDVVFKKTALSMQKKAEDPNEFTGKDVNDYAKEMKQTGYEFKIKTSTSS